MCPSSRENQRTEQLMADIFKHWYFKNGWAIPRKKCHFSRTRIYLLDEIVNSPSISHVERCASYLPNDAKDVELS